jgi:ribose 5-phosphate isomerase A
MVAALLREGTLHDIVAIACSRSLERYAGNMGIPMSTLEKHPVVDLTIDGADEVSPAFELIKGRGGALLREKIVAQASRREVIVIDESKLSPAVGRHAPLPVEVLPFGWRSQAAFLESLGARVRIRTDRQGRYRLTDQGNMLIDADFGIIPHPELLAEALDARAGIIAHGLFIDLATEVVVATRQGVRVLTVREPRGAGPAAQSDHPTTT